MIFADKIDIAFPLVTVGVPNYNYSQYILYTLNSVINQSYPNIELIIIDDLSTDNSITVIQEWIDTYSGEVKIRFLKNNTNIGLTCVCNLLLENASGKYIQFLDADDLILPHKLEQQVVLLERTDEVAVVYSDIHLINAEGKVFGNGYLDRIGYDRNCMPSGKIHGHLFDFNFIPLPSVLVRTELIRSVGGFDETVAVQDYYLWLKLTEQYEVIFMSEAMGMYRVHLHSMSNSQLTSPRSIDSILTICYRYYKNADALIQKKIKRTIHDSAPNLYKLKYPTSIYWLKIDLMLNPGFKNLLYYAGRKLGIPYSFFENIKSKFFLGLFITGSI